MLVRDASELYRVHRDIYAEASVSSTLMLGYRALRATTKAGSVEAGCCATLMRRAAPWLETSSRHVRRVASRLSSPPLEPDTNAASAAHETAFAALRLHESNRKCFRAIPLSFQLTAYCGALDDRALPKTGDW